MDNQNRKLELLGNAPIPKALLAMGIPTMIGMLINALYNLVDAYFVGGLSDYVRQKSQRNKPLVFLLPIFNRQEHRNHRWSCFQPYIAFVCKRRQNYPPRCKRHRFRISPQCLHGRFLRRLPNQKR